jgi:ABC-2 type transport system permease protein
MRRIWQIFKLNLGNSLRDNLLAYVLIAPIFLAFILKIFFPAVQANSIDVAILSENLQLQEKVSLYADVKLVENREKMEEAVKGIDDTVGFIEEKDNRITILYEGTEESSVRDIAELTAAKIQGYYDYPIEIEKLNKQGKSPFLPYLAAFMAIMALLISGMIIGFAIIEEKESGTISALMVTPLNRTELIIGHSITGIFTAFGLTLAVTVILGVEGISYVKLITATAVGTLLSIFFGFALGSISSNQINGIANFKIASLLLIMPPLITLFISEGKEIFLYWLPSYWSYAAFRAVLVFKDNWIELLKIATVGVGVTVVWLLIIYLTLKKRIEANI